MTTILHIDSSSHGTASVSRQLSAHAVALLVKADPEAKIITRDLVRNPLPHLGVDFLGGMMSTTPTTDEAAAIARSDAAVAELMSADVIVIGAPMYNFSVPSQLKTWIDHVCRAGKTFQYTAEGPKGLLSGKRAIIAASTGGVYSAGAFAAYDHVASYLRQVLGFLGITDVTVVMAEKQGMGGDAAAAEVAAARTALDQKIGQAA